MFSFGTIKHCTALFGAVTNIKPQNEYHVGSKPFHEAAEEIEARYPLYSVEDYKKKIKLMCVANFFTVNPMSVAVMTRIFKWCGIDGEEQ